VIVQQEKGNCLHDHCKNWDEDQKTYLQGNAQDNFVIEQNESGDRQEGYLALVKKCCLGLIFRL
jgi:hypothetical protein